MDFRALFAPTEAEGAPDFRTLFAPTVNPYNDEGPSWSEQPQPNWRDQEADETLKAMGLPVAQPAQPNVYRGNVLPFSRNTETGERSLSVPGFIQDPATLPGDVYAGKVDLSSPEGTGRALGFAAAALPVPPASRIKVAPRAAPDRPIEATPMPRASIRSEAELQATGGSRMGAAKKSEATVSPEDMQGALADFNAKLREASLRPHPKLHPKAAAVNEDLIAAAQSPQTLEELHYLRQLTDDVAATPGVEGKIGMMMKSAVDSMIAKHPEGSSFKQGTSEFARAMKSKVITDALANAKNSTQYMRGDQAGAIRNAVKPLLDKKFKGGKYWTPGERRALEKVRRFGIEEGLGGLFGSTGAMGLAIGRVAETALGIPPTMAFPAGWALRQSANASKTQALEKVAEMVRAGGPVAQSRVQRVGELFSQKVFENLAGQKEGAKRIAAWALHPSSATSRALALYVATKLRVPDLAARIMAELQGTAESQADQ